MDVRTLVLAVGIAGLAETLVLVVQSRIDRVHSGPGWWALGIATITASFFAAVGLGPGSGGTPFIEVAVGLRSAGFALMFVGCLRFVGGRERAAPIAVLSIVPIAVAAVFGLAGEQYRGYLLTTASTSVVGSAAILWILLGPGTRDFRRSAVVAAAGFGLLAVFFAIRIPILVVGGPVEDPYASTTVNQVSQLVRLVAILWATVGLVLMSNERLARELVASRERVDRAERAEMVARFAGGIAHNFNNLLQVIGGHAELMRAGLPPGDPLLDDVDAISGAADRATTLTRQLLEFGRREPSRPAVVCVDEVLDDLRPFLTEMEGGQLVVTLQPGAPGAIVSMDPAHLREAVAALVLRARERQPRDGPIRVTTSVSDVAADDPLRRPTARPGPFVRIAVTDPGEVIEPERLAHVFEPFYSTESGGWGPEVGLSSVEGLVVEAGGFMAARSDADSGTVFSAFLPLVTAPADG